MAEPGRYRLSPRALTDLEEIWSYPAARWSPEQAESYHTTIMATFEGLAAGRKQGRPVDVRAGYWKYPVGSHLVFYRLSETGIDVMRLLHQRMDVRRHL
ncbi:type II toxin-antitoxin system RelE/ParE family toxin [Bosea sp. 124]|uniref:type II toxin-antitoxin system RelE/ParE family toxin n=1 Tax=Bosea sp. 124 TaxID=2135642 RepID=UPI000D37B2D8|nr:type II toxin-antitoxin system RelE/ParE family toxin [Bosea sp. 124]PTM42653.1 toxin ParE1/3/4 [Bosea sp. 124]